MKKISFIYFDLGGVVVSNARAHDRLARETGKPAREIKAFLDATDDIRGRGKHDMQKFLHEFKAAFRVDHPAINFADFWSDYLEPIGETHTLIYELSFRYKLGILSNAEPGVIAYNIKKGKVPNIPWAAIVESAQFGFVKPEPQLFRVAQEMAGVPPGEILFIDDKTKNIEVARALGWQGERFDHTNVSQSVKSLRRKLLPK